jgi:hypothetical protein
MMKRNLAVGGLTALLLAVGLVLVMPQQAEASIHEIIAALCRGGGLDNQVEPPGQNRFGSQSFLRALQASGFITSIVETPTLVTINFDPTVPNSKFISAGSDLTIPNGAGPGVALTLSPLPVPDPQFPAHSHCRNFE